MMKQEKKSFVRIRPSKSRVKSVSVVKADDSKVVEGEILDAETDDFSSDDAGYSSDEHWEQAVTIGTDKDEVGLTYSDPLTRYLKELRKYPLMTSEEEYVSALSAYEKNDVSARHRLVTANLRLVVKIAMEYRRAYVNVLDLVQEGNAGLVQAVNRFNPYRGVKLSTYSAWWIRAYILKFLMDNKSIVRMGTTDAQRKLFFRLRSEAQKMYALTQTFDTKLLAEKIGVKESDVIDMHQRLSKGDSSLDAPVVRDGELRQIDTLVDTEQSGENDIDNEQVLSILRREMGSVEKDLNERDVYILRNRIAADEPVSLQEIGDKYGITRERARQLESKIISKIKEKMISAGVEPE